MPLLPRLRSRHLRTGFHRNTEPDVPGAIPAIHVDTHVPFRMEEYGDTQNTVATSGCGILIAKFLERTYNSKLNVSVEELAKLAVMKGYRGYRKKEDGTYAPMGMKHVFFERFITSLYGFSSNRDKTVQ